MSDGTPGRDGRLGHSRNGTYVESPIIMTTVRVVAPFALTYGLFLAFHGADSPGGSFQGGTIAGATVLMIAFAYGIEPTANWFANRTVVALAAGGALFFVLVGLVPMAYGDSFLAHPFYEEQWGIDTIWALEAIEVGGVAPIVAGIFVGLFFVIGRGYRADGTAWFEHEEDSFATGNDRVVQTDALEPTETTGSDDSSETDEPSNRTDDSESSDRTEGDGT